MEPITFLKVRWSVPVLLYVEGSYNITLCSTGYSNINLSIKVLHCLSSEYRSVVAICVLYYMIPDVRIKQDHTRIITIVEVRQCIFIGCCLATKAFVLHKL